VLYPDRDAVEFIHYCCEDPTCDWGSTQFDPEDTGVSCKESAKIRDSLLTFEEENGYRANGRGASVEAFRQGDQVRQTDFFRQ